MFKRYVSIFLTAALLLCASAQADTLQSQFGYDGWPKEPSIPTSAPQNGASCEENGQNQPSTPTKEPIAATSAPAVPTQAPQATHTPLSRPTVENAPSSDDDYTTDSISMQEKTAWNLLNADRKANGMPALTLDPELCRIARIKSEDMRDGGYFAHESPTWGNVKAMLRSFGYPFAAAGENIAHHANLDKAQAAFMSSAGHRRNILSSVWTKVGLGLAYDRNGYIYLTQIFAK